MRYALPCLVLLGLAGCTVPVESKSPVCANLTTNGWTRSRICRSRICMAPGSPVYARFVEDGRINQVDEDGRELNDILMPPPQILDTLAIWPENVEIKTGELVQFWRADLFTNGLLLCEFPAPAPGALYESGSFTSGCDSAIAQLFK